MRINMPFNTFSSLRGTLTVVFVFLAIVPIGVLGISLGILGISTLRSDAIILQGEKARLASSEIASLVNARINQLELLTTVRRLSSLDEAEQVQVLSSLLNYDNTYRSLTLINANGQERFTVEEGRVVSRATTVDYSQANVFQVPLTSQAVYVSPVTIREATGEPVLQVALPLIDLRSGQVEAVLLADVRFLGVSQLLARQEFRTQDDTVYVVDDDNRIVAHPNSSVVLRGDEFAVPPRNDIVIGQSGTQVVLAQDQIQFGAERFTVVAERTTSAALSIVNAGIMIVAIVTFVALIAAIVALFYLISRIVQPIESLSATATAISRGDLSARSDVTSKDEIGELAQSFNSMTNTVQERERDLREARDEALSAQRIAQENSRLKSEFLSTMSHELRTPMNAIEGFTGIMLKKMARVDYNEAAERYLNKIRSNSRRLLGLINDFLDLSRIEAGRMELAYMPMQVHDVAQSWHDNLSSLAEDKQLAFHVNVSRDVPQTLVGDEEALSKIAINLLGNAIKFTESGEVALELTLADDQLKMTVRDTGIGIPPHARELIFDEFRQVDGSSKRQYGGTGLGLTIVQKIVREMGGRVTVDSELGAGSTFTVLVPINVAAEAA